MTANRAAAVAHHFPTTGTARDLLIALAHLADGNGTFAITDMPLASAAAHLDATTTHEAYQVLLMGGWIIIDGEHGHIQTGDPQPAARL
jgi:hypothetical protein